MFQRLFLLLSVVLFALSVSISVSWVNEALQLYEEHQADRAEWQR